ncbi:ABC-type antimicrobial peptide transport system permease subunit [Staphylococcus auricularis]
MTKDKFNDEIEPSNTVMTHTAETLTESDFVRSDYDIEKEPEMQRESKSFWQDAWLQLKQNKLAIVGLIGLVLIIILALVGPLLSNHTYEEQNIEHRNLPAKVPVLDKVPFLPFNGEGTEGDAYEAAGAKENYWFGTDQLGRDLWSRTWQGAQVSLHRCHCSVARYFYRRRLWCDIRILRGSTR